MAPLVTWPYPPSQGSRLRAVLRQRRDQHPLLIRVQDSHTQTWKDDSGNYLADAFDDAGDAQSASDSHLAENTDPFDLETILPHLDWGDRQPTPYISTSGSVRWALWEGYSRLLGSGQRPRSPRVRILVIVREFLDHWLEVYNLLEVAGRGGALKREQYLTKAAQEILVYGLIPSGAILSEVEIDDIDFKAAVESLYAGLTTNPTSSGRSFRDAWAGQRAKWDAEDKVSAVALGERGARLAMALLVDQWTFDLGSLEVAEENEVIQVLDIVADHTSALAEQILLEIFELALRDHCLHGRVYEGIDTAIRNKRYECLADWRAARSAATHSPASQDAACVEESVPELVPDSRSPDASTDSIEELLRDFAATKLRDEEEENGPKKPRMVSAYASA